MAYGEDFRRTVLSFRAKNGLTLKAVAVHFGVGLASVTRWVRRPAPQKTHACPARVIDRITLARDVREHPDSYQWERAPRLGASQRGICSALKRMQITHKKSLHHPRADETKRHMFNTRLDMHKAQGHPIVYVDESGFAHDMPRTHAYALCGQKCWGVKDWNARGRTNVIGAILGNIFLATGLFRSTIKSDLFHEWSVNVLIPNLPPNSVVVMDNATFHKRKDIIKAYKTSGHILLFLPPYSPDLNPIEKKWAQMKKLRQSLQISTKGLFNKESFYNT